MVRKLRTGRGLALTAALAVAMVPLAACAGSASTASTNSAGTTSVVIGLGGNIFDLPEKLAVDQGYFTKEGIKPSFVTLTSATGVTALESGSVQILPASPLDLVQAVSKQLPIEAVSAVGSGNPLGLVVSTKFAKAHNLTSSTAAATVAKALSGSTAGYSSANTKAEASIYLKADGVDPTTINWVELPSPAADKSALTTNQISWFVTSEPVPLEIQGQGDGVVVASEQTVPQWNATSAGYGLFTAVKQSYATANPKVVKEVVAAIKEATAYINANPTSPAVLKAAEQTLPGVPDSVLTKSVQQVTWSADGSMSQADWNTTLSFLTSLGSVQGGAKITSSNWTNKYLP
jgi:NitT/TauT family transport system substrate-binding protein